MTIAKAHELGIDLENSMVTYEEDSGTIVYDTMESFLSGEIEKLKDTGSHRLLHLMSPAEKHKELKRDQTLMEERKKYLAGGNEAFRKKHGGMDPFEYHLLAYEE